jgi:hypothetical protein
VQVQTVTNHTAHTRQQLQQQMMQQAAGTEGRSFASSPTGRMVALQSPSGGTCCAVT